MLSTAPRHCIKTLPLLQAYKFSYLLRIFTGGGDKVINILDKKLKKLAKIVMDELIPDAVMPKIRSICLKEDGSKLLVGTFGSEIYELTPRYYSISLASSALPI